MIIFVKSSPCFDITGEVRERLRSGGLAAKAVPCGKNRCEFSACLKLKELKSIYCSSFDLSKCVLKCYSFNMYLYSKRRGARVVESGGLAAKAVP